MKLYKLTDENGQTRNGFQWGENITHGKDELCSGHLYYAYTCPVLAALIYPVHIPISNPYLWEAEGIPSRVRADIVGCKKLTTRWEIKMPRITTIQRVVFGILCALEVYKEPGFVKWANNWLLGIDRSKKSTWALIETGDWSSKAAALAIRAASAASGWHTKSVALLVARAAVAASIETPIDLVNISALLGK